MSVKRCFSLLLAVLLLIGAMPVFAAETDELVVEDEGVCGAQGDNVTYKITYNKKDPTMMTLTITGEGDMKDFGPCVDVQNRSPWYHKYNRAVWYIVIGEGVTSIGDYAFQDYQEVRDVKIPDTVTKIGNYAFERCDDLKTCNIPKNLVSIGDCAFLGTSLYGTITFPETMRSIGERAFSYCQAIDDFVIPAGLTDLGKECFTGTRWWRRFPSPYITVNGVLFEVVAARNVKEATVPDGVEAIADGVFADLAELTTVTVPQSVKKIGKNAFFPEGGNKDGHFTLRGASGSYAETYAKANGIRFEAVTLPEPTVTPQPTATPTPKPTLKPGDVTGDGAITSADALQIQRYVVKRDSVLQNASKEVLDAADVTKDGEITSADALQIQRYVVKRPSVLDGK